MKKKEKNSENYLEKIPARNQEIEWATDDEGKVTLNIPNTGIFNKIAQKLLNRPPVTYVHLDEHGSFVWQLTDGERDIISLGEDVKAKFGDAAEPIYPRLAKFFQILDSYGFIEWK